MRSSNDFFTHDTSTFENLDNTFVPRQTVPLYADKLTLKPNLPPPPKQSLKVTFKIPAPTPQPRPVIPHPLPKVNYPVFTPPPKPVQNTALEEIQQQILKEVSDLKKHKPTLDQLIQTALKQKIQHDHQVVKQKIVTIKKISSPMPNPYITQKQPFQKPSRQLWWPDQEKVNFQQTTPKTIVKTAINSVPAPVTEPKPEPIPIKGSNIKDVAVVPRESLASQLDPLLESITETFAKKPEVKPIIAPVLKPINNTNFKTQQLKTSSFNMAKTAFHISFNLINYFLFTVSPEIDPYNDSHRQYMVFGLKGGGYLTALVGIFEMIRNFNTGLSLNGQFEAVSIFLISGILFFFGENLNILFKPVNPYQVHEVV